MANIFNNTNIHYYHLFSAGTKTDVLFHNQEEFVNGMNIVALTTYELQIQVIAFCLMDNHFHFVLHTTEEKVNGFAGKITHVYTTRRSKCYADKLLENIKWEAKLIPEDESLQKTIAYVIRNPHLISNTEMVFDYPWASNSLYFHRKECIEKLKKNFRTVGSLPVRKYRELVRSKKKLPDDWLLTDDGYIWPGSYVDFHCTETIFQTWKSYLFYVNARKQNQEEEFLTTASRIRISDAEIREEAKRICVNEYGTDRFKKLSLEKRIETAATLIRHFGCSKKQICRIVNLEDWED